MSEFGKAIREEYGKIGVSINVQIFLCVDNAGGHQTNKVEDQYKRMLKEDYNVICIHQHPRSTATTMLNLGVWMAFQSVVEKMHHNQR